jgi:ribosomal protein S18 acetylase RimI-like enzyme
MSISYRNTKEFTVAQLQDLFLSVGWDSGNHPEKLQAAVRNSDRVKSAWDGDVLVGLMTGISDGVMTAYFHYLLVRPEYQGGGIGKELVQHMLEHYSECMTKVLIAYNYQVGFYERCGFSAGRESTPMFATTLKL